MNILPEETACAATSARSSISLFALLKMTDLRTPLRSNDTRSIYIIGKYTPTRHSLSRRGWAHVGRKPCSAVFVTAE